jgi:hypothetical protein
MESSNQRSASDLRQGSPRRWLSRLILAAILLVALAVSVVATTALTRSARTRTHQVHVEVGFGRRQEGIVPGGLHVDHPRPKHLPGRFCFGRGGGRA